MRYEKPYTKLEEVISRFLWHYIEERPSSILKKLLPQKLNSAARYVISKVKVAKS